MALYPAAKHLLIPPGSNDPRIKPRVGILHVADMLGPSLYDYFAHRSGGIESHFYIRLDGAVEQYRDTDYQADANLDANDFAVSIETEGKAAGEWTPAQIAAIKALLSWLHDTHDIPWRKIQHWDGSGFGYHTLFGSPSHWTPVAKSCPGPARIKQFDAVLVPWIDAQGRPAPVKRSTATLRVVDWNVQRDRGPKTVLHELQHLAARADVMTLQEVAGYRDVKIDGERVDLLEQIDGFHCASFADDTAVLVRDGREVKAACAVRVTSRGWFTVRGGQTGPKSAAACIVDGIGCASVHTPPTVQSKVKRLAAPRRWAAYRELMTSMPALVAHLGSRCVVAGDWNVDAGSDKGTLTGWPLKTFANLPQHLRRHVPKDGTHGKRVIDYVFARNVHVGTVRVVDGHFGSDHRPISFSVHA